MHFARAALAIIVVAGAVAACGNSREPTPSAGSSGSDGSAARAASPGADVIKGSIVVRGEELAITRCNPQHDVRTFVELETAKGILRFKEAKLYWHNELLTCERLDRSWGGGVRPSGAAYWRGTLSFTCDDVSGSVDADCGSITADERASLDSNRQQLLDDQAAQKNAGSTGSNN